MVANSSRVIAPPMFISLLFGILEGSKHLHSAISYRPGRSVYRCRTRSGVVNANSGDGGSGHYWDRAAGRQVTSSAH